MGFSERAKSLTAAGYPVFPCGENKRPLTPRGYKDASKDPAQIAEWGKRWPDALVAVPTGSASGLFVLDVDVKGQHNGYDTLTTLHHRGHTLPDTWTHQTRTGGVHFVFRVSAGTTLKNSVQVLGPGLDTRGEGGYIIWWPVHDVPVRSTTPPATVPDWIVAALSGATPGPRTKHHETDDPGLFFEGQRNDGLFRMAAFLRSRGYSGEGIRALLLEENLIRCSPPLDTAEVEQIAQSASRYELGRQLTAPFHAVSPTTKRLIAVRGTDVQMKPIRWIWPDWLAAGKTHVLAGVAGTGKTTVALSLAATITRGGRWADGSAAPRGRIVIWSGEDHPADVLIPRLTAMGADLTQVTIADRVVEGTESRFFDPSQDLDALHAYLSTADDVRLVVIDPLVSAVAGDSHKNAEVRRGLQPLVDLATEYDCAVLGITHLTKNTVGREPVERVTGSLAFGALARVVIMALKMQKTDHYDRQRYLLCVAKSNLGRHGIGYEYHMETQTIARQRASGPEIKAVAIRWGPSVAGDIRQILAAAETPQSRQAQDAQSYLLDLLRRNGGQMAAKDVIAEAKDAGISERTIRRARAALNIQQDRKSFQGISYWVLPELAKLKKIFKEEKK